MGVRPLQLAWSFRPRPSIVTRRELTDDTVLGCRLVCALSLSADRPGEVRARVHPPIRPFLAPGGCRSDRRGGRLPRYGSTDPAASTAGPTRAVGYCEPRLEHHPSASGYSGPAV